MSMLSHDELRELSPGDYRPQQVAELADDGIARYKEVYAREGAGRTNLAYGYVRK